MSTELINDLRNQIAAREALVIVGAGVSLAATNGNHLASWKGLLEHGAKYCRSLPSTQVDDAWEHRIHDQINSGDLIDLLTAAENISEHLEAPKGAEFRRWLKESIGSLHLERREVFHALRDLGVPIATTNYDGLIEEATGLSPFTWMDGPQFHETLRGARNGILHLHGYWDKPESVVLGVRSYAEVLGNAHAQAMQQAMCVFRTLVFIGFGAGLHDPNFRGLLKWMGTTLPGSTFRHFRLSTQSEAVDTQREHSSDQGIHVLPYGRLYGDLAPFLRKLQPATHRANILISHAPEVASVFPLPPSPVCFGREVEVNMLVSTLLSERPAPTPVIGAPGIGKTTVVLVALNEPRVAHHYGRRRFFIRCDAAQSREAMAAEIARAIGVEINSNIEPAILLTLSSAPTALILDNLETPWAKDQTRVEELLGLLARVPNCALIVTLRGASRPFNVPWRDSVHLPVLTDSDSRQAFHHITSNHFVTDRHLKTLLLALDNIPIGISLMAHAAQGEPNLEGVLTRWQSERTGMLISGDANTAQLSIEVCYEASIRGPRMTDEARDFLAILALLPDGVLQSHIHKIWPEWGLRAANTLTTVGLAFYENERLRLLAPLREYVCKEHGVAPNALNSLFAFYFSLAAEGEKAGREGGAEAIAQVAQESANIEVAILIGLEQQNCIPAIEAALCMARFTRFSGTGSTLFLERATGCANKLENHHLWARCRKRHGDIAIQRADEITAKNCFKDALTFFTEDKDSYRAAGCIAGLGFVSLHHPDFSAARMYFENALFRYTQLDDSRGKADCIKWLGDIELDQEKLNAARNHYADAQTLYKRLDNKLGLANSSKGLGDLHRRRRQHPEALHWYKVAIQYYREIGDALGEANCQECMGHIEKDNGVIGKAITYYQTALILFQRVRDPYSIAGCFECLANVIRPQEDPHKYARAAIDIWRSVGRADKVMELGAKFGLPQ